MLHNSTNNERRGTCYKTLSHYSIYSLIFSFHEIVVYLHSNFCSSAFQPKLSWLGIPPSTRYTRRIFVYADSSSVEFADGPGHFRDDGSDATAAGRSC